MENKTIQYSTLFAAIFIIVLMAINLFKTSNNLKEAKNKIDSALQKIEESNTLVKEQATIINDLKKLNDDLNKKVLSIDSTNSVIKRNIDVNFYNANRNIENIRKMVVDIKTVKLPL